MASRPTVLSLNFNKNRERRRSVPSYKVSQKGVLFLDHDFALTDKAISVGLPMRASSPTDSSAMLTTVAVITPLHTPLSTPLHTPDPTPNSSRRSSIEHSLSPPFDRSIATPTTLSSDDDSPRPSADVGDGQYSLGLFSIDERQDKLPPVPSVHTRLKNMRINVTAPPVTEEVTSPDTLTQLQRRLGSRNVRFKDLRSMFHIGAGGSSTVFKAKLHRLSSLSTTSTSSSSLSSSSSSSSSSLVAVKKLSIAERGVRRAIRNELAVHAVLTKLPAADTRSLVSLIGGFYENSVRRLLRTSKN
jgi:hypothetical protein